MSPPLSGRVTRAAAITGWWVGRDDTFEQDR
jgi:hypothetical protein